MDSHRTFKADLDSIMYYVVTNDKFQFLLTAFQRFVNRLTTGGGVWTGGRVAGDWRQLEIQLLSLPPTDWGHGEICRQYVNSGHSLSHTGCVMCDNLSNVCDNLSWMCDNLPNVCDNLSAMCDNLSGKTANLSGFFDHLSSLCDFFVLQDDFPTKIVVTKLLI